MTRGAKPPYDFMDIPDLILDVDRTGDIWHFELSHRELVAVLDRIQNGGGDIGDIYALIEGFELPTDWKRYLYVYAKDQLGLPLAADEKNYLSNGGVHLRRQHIERWNADGAEVKKEIGFIRATREWAMQHAPAEYEQLQSRYHDLIWQKNWLPMEIGHFASVEERVDGMHNSFFEALSEMPADSRIWTEYLSAIGEPSSAGQVSKSGGRAVHKGENDRAGRASDKAEGGRQGGCYAIFRYSC